MYRFGIWCLLQSSALAFDVDTCKPPPFPKNTSVVDIDKHIARMTQYTLNHPMLEHRFLVRFQHGAFIDMKHAVRAFAKEHYSYSRKFIDYLRAVVDKISDSAAKAPILENINEENGNYEDEDLDLLETHGVKREWVNKKPHKELIKHFLDVIGVDLSSAKDDAPGVQFTKYMLDLYAKSNACEGLAILGFAIEDTVSTMYQFIWAGLKKADWLKPEDYVFFPLHILVDDGHADLLKAAYKQYMISDPDSCKGAPNIIVEVLARRIEFMDQILALADKPPVGTLPISDGDADRHIASMSQFSLNHAMLQHPFLKRFQHGLFLDFPHAIRAFAKQHYTYSRNFIKYLTAVVEKVPDEATRAPILENISEESGNYEEEDLAILESHGLQRAWVDKKPHKELIRNFLDAIGVKLDFASEHSPGSRFTKYMLDMYDQSTACEGLAILGFAIEDTVSTMYEFIWDGLKKSSMQPQDYVFFPLHILVDDGHADLLKSAYKKYLVSDQASQCENAPRKVEQVLARRVQFMNEILDLAERNISHRALTSEQADAHIRDLSVYSINHAMLQHPFLHRFQHGLFVDFPHAVRTFGREHYTYSRNFIKYLTAVVEKVPDEATRAPILENISEESGNYEEEDLAILASHGVPREWVNKKPHKELIAHFLEKIGVTFNNDTSSPGMEFTNYMLEMYAESNACEGLAILGFAIEDTVSTLYKFIWAGLKKTALNPQDYVFFPLHILVDDGHADLLKAAYKKYLVSDSELCVRAPALVQKVLQRRIEFMDRIVTLADAPTQLSEEAATNHVAIMSEYAQNHELLAHPFLKRFAKTQFADFRHAVRMFGQEHYTYSRKFINYLRAVADKIPDEATRAPILENIDEENGNYEADDLATLEKHGIKTAWVNKKPHKELIASFLKTINVTVNENENAPGARFTEYMLKLYATSNACEGLAIIGFAIEDTVSRLYESIWDGLKKSWLPPESYVFFPLHILVDDGHADLLKTAYKMHLTSNSTATAHSCANAPALVANVLRRRQQFLDEILELADTPPTSKDSSMAAMIQAAQKRTAGQLKHPEYTQSQKIALAARFLHRVGHTNSLAGQVSCLEMLGDGSFGMRTLKYGIGFDEATPSSLILVDKDLNNADKNRSDLFPNYAIRFHVHIYFARPDTRCIVHTHPPHANALGLTGSALAADHMDFLGLFDEVAYQTTWPGVPFGDEEGQFMVEALGKKNNAAILAHHGMLAIGSNMEEALYRAFFLEENAALQLRVMSATNQDIPRVDTNLAQQAQKWRMSRGPVNAHFHYWARQVLAETPGLLDQ